MSEKKEKTSTFSDFFIENVEEVPKEGNPTEQELPHLFSELPSLPKIESVDEDELKAWWRNLRTFFRSGKGGGIGKESVYPALLAPYQNLGQARGEYPLWLADEQVVQKKTSKTHCDSLAGLITHTIDAFAAEDKATILRMNVDRIVEITRKRIGEEPKLFEAVIGDILSDLANQLEVKGEESVAFVEDLKKLEEKLPKSGVLIPFSASASYQIFGAALAAEQGARTNELKKEISLLCAKLKDALSVETAKSPKGRKPTKLHSSYDFADTFLNFDELSKALPQAGSELMEEDRFKRIEGVLKTLQGAESLLGKATIIFQKELFVNKKIDLKEIFYGSEVKTVAKGKTCVEAGNSFEEKMKGVAIVIAAMRIGQLEIEGHYNHGVHADYFSKFDWRSFTDKEMSACPPVVLISEVETIVDSELSDFSHLLSTNTIIKTLAIKKDSSVDFRMNGSPPSNDFVFRQELGALVVSHRNTYTMQSTPVSPIDLFNGFSEGLESFSPALFYVLSPNEKTEKDPYLWCSAAVEGREFPGFTYKGNLDSKWGSRFNISNNPQKGNDWPIYELNIKGKDTLKLPFTFADFAAQDSQYSHHFQIVPPQYWNEDLVEVADYLKIEDEEKYSKIPFVWLTNESNVLQKVAISWHLVMASKERLDFWHYVQENGGVNSYHVEKAMDEASEELHAEAEKEIKSLKEEHLKEIEKVKDDTAGQAMEKLTSMLLDLDSASLVSGPSSLSSDSSPTTPVEEGKLEIEEEKEENSEPTAEKGLLASEAYIDTALCTTCDECTNLNNKIFAYDADKLAFVSDPKGGPFVDIVEAAELCPVSIIHPGTPLDPNEPGLDDLILRAEKYN
jgi:ferredoxin